VSEIRLVENPDATTWNDFVQAQHGHLLQSYPWGELKSRFGWSALRLAVACDQELVAGSQILFRQLPFGLSLAYIPRGPIVDSTDHNTVTVLFDALCRTAKSRGAFALKLEPNWLEAITADDESRSTHYESLLTHYQRFPSNSIQPRTSIHLDLTRDLDTILAQMKPKWRLNIRLAARKGVTVRAGNLGDIPAFYRLLQITSARDQFAVHSEQYYRCAFELFTSGENARLFVAEYSGEPLAMIFVTALGGEAIYLYGASSDSNRERMPNHALHWAAIQWAKERGCSRYDLWGLGATTDADANAAHGLYQFKQGFGGTSVRYVSAVDVVFTRWQYALYKRAIEFRRGSP
jgi:peptidoglycan pentaglycine glycine transferase (the first glycine)